jgi:uncharacterized membrane protein
MSNTNRTGVAVLVGVFMMGGLTGCATWNKLDRTEQGALIGAGGGAVVGGVMGGTEGAVLGGVGGGVAGGVIGHNTGDDD